MKYTYFPGCSLEAGSIGYNMSTLAVSDTLGIELKELEDWNCCGATAYTSITDIQAFAICARNLALAEKEGRDIVAPCSACYTTMRKTNTYLRTYPEVKEKVGKALAAAGLSYGGGIRVVHLAEILTDGNGTMKALGEKVKVKLAGLKVACYHGCQIVRPGGGFDDPEFPTALDRLMTALGAEPVPFPMTARCCGGSMIVSRREIALHHLYKILRCAADSGAQCIVTACPLCHLTLDAYQGMVNRKFGTHYRIPIMYFPQLIGIALGFKPKELGIEKNIIGSKNLLGPYSK